jgi:hypothetical protein
MIFIYICLVIRLCVKYSINACQVNKKQNLHCQTHLELEKPTTNSESVVGFLEI